MTEPRKPHPENELSPATRDPAEGARGPDRGGEPAREPQGKPGHLGPAGDPAEGKDPKG